MKGNLSLEYLRSILDYDPATGVFRWKVYRARGARAGDVAGTRHGRGYIQIVIGGVGYLAHRLAVFYMTGEAPPEVDHRNGVKDDNRFGNLRDATRSQQMRNKRKRSDSSHPFKGISKRGNKFRARIFIEGKNRQLGTFATAEDAAMAYDAAARRHYGEFARVNFDA